MTVTGPEQLRQGEIAEFRITVRNTSNVAAQDVIVRADYDPQLTPYQMSSDIPQLDGGELGWRIPAIEPGGVRVPILQFRCSDPGQACCRVRTTSGPDIVVDGEKCFTILPTIGGAPAAGNESVGNDRGLPLLVTIPGGRAQAGRRLTVWVEIRNNTNDMQRDVQYRIFVPNTLQVDGANISPAFAGQSRQTENGLELTFPPFAQLAPGQRVSFAVPMSAVAPGTTTIYGERAAEGIPADRFDTPLEIRPRS